MKRYLPWIKTKWPWLAITVGFLALCATFVVRGDIGMFAVWLVLLAVTYGLAVLFGMHR